MKIGTALMSFCALATSLLLAGCGSDSKPAPAAAATAAVPPAPPPPTLYDAEAFFATTSYIMPAGYAWSADDKQLLVSSDETGIYNVYALPAAARQAAADVLEGRFDFRRVMVSGRRARAVHRGQAAATRSTICTCAKRTARRVT